MSKTYTFNLIIKQFKPLLILFLFIHLNGCSTTYLQWWDEEMFLYRPSVIESAAMRSVTQEKIVQVAKNGTLELNYGLALRAVNSSDTSIAIASINEYEYFNPGRPNKTIVITGVSNGIATVIANLQDGNQLKIIVNVTGL